MRSDLFCSFSSTSSAPSMHPYVPNMCTLSLEDLSLELAHGPLSSSSKHWGLFGVFVDLSDSGDGFGACIGMLLTFAKVC